VNASLIAPQPERHLVPISQLLDTVWGDGVEVNQHHYLGNSHYDYEASRIALLEDKVISHWGVWGYEMRLGSATLKTGGIGAVATAEQYRRRGLMTRVGHASLKAMQEAGYDLSVLHGFTTNYARFGYVRAWTYETYEITIGDLDVQGQVPSFAPIHLNKNDSANALYNTSHQHFAGTAVRPTYQNILMRQRKIYGWTENEILQGYVYIEILRDEKVLRCMEVVGDTPPALLILLQLAKANECERVRFETLPHDHSMLVHLRCGTVRVIKDYNKSYGLKNNGWMVKVVNLRSCLEKLVPDFSKRLLDSAYANWQGNLFLKNNEEQVLLEIDHSDVSVASPKSSAHTVEGGHHLVQLLLGTEEPLEVVMAARTRLTGDAEKLIRILFPQQYPTLSEWDHF
jgi:predicted acetyltransferase